MPGCGGASIGRPHENRMVRLRTLSLVPHLVALLVAAAVPAATTVQPAPEARGVRAGAPQAQERAASPPRSTPGRQQILDTMKRATRFMVEKISTRGGYVWTYLPDLSRRWGELEARDTQIWMQPPGTATMGHSFDTTRPATSTTDARRTGREGPSSGAAPSGGWNYVVDFCRRSPAAHCYATIGRNAWRLERVPALLRQCDFDDGGTAEARAAAPCGWISRSSIRSTSPHWTRHPVHPRQPVPAGDLAAASAAARLRTTGCPTNLVIPHSPRCRAENIEFLIQCYQTLGDPSLLDPFCRGMHASSQRSSVRQPGWRRNSTTKVEAAGACEPRALATHDRAEHRDSRPLTGSPGDEVLARIPEALDWLGAVKLRRRSPRRSAPTPRSSRAPTTRYVHREGSTW